MWNPFSDATKGAVEGFGNAISGIVKDFKADPTKVVEFETNLQKEALAYQASVIGAVNATMQAEASSSSWLQQDWRPIVGLTYALMIVNNYVLMPYFSHVFNVPLINIPDAVLYSMMSILGVTTLATMAEKTFGNGKGGV